MGFNSLKATEPLQSDSLLLLFTTQFPGFPGTHLIDLGRLSQPWSHQVVLNLGPLNWESSALTTRSLIRSLTKFLDPCLSKSL